AAVELIGMPGFGRAAPALFDRWRSGQPGAISRDDHMWRRLTGESVRPGETYTAPFAALYRDASGEPQGVLVYHVDRSFSEGGDPDCTLQVVDRFTATREAAEVLWRYAFSVDWVQRVEAR